nr:MAG TPA: hypothetical protein [Bacteriophage sp.]
MKIKNLNLTCNLHYRLVKMAKNKSFQQSIYQI